MVTGTASEHAQRPRTGLSLAAGLTSLHCSLALVGGLSCADALNIPSDPRLAEEAPQSNGAETSQTEVVAAASALPSLGGGSPPPLTSSSGESGPGDLELVAVAEVTPASGMNSQGDTTEPVSDVAAEQVFADAGVVALDAGSTIEPQAPDVCGGLAVLGPNDRCFAVQNELLAWPDARLACQARGAEWDLASIRSDEVSLFVAELTAEELWIGASDLEVEGTWLWVDDGSNFWLGDAEDGQAQDGFYVNWNSSEPNGRGNSGCARTVPNSEAAWADLECEFERAALCQGPRPELVDGGVTR